MKNESWLPKQFSHDVITRKPILCGNRLRGLVKNNDTDEPRLVKTKGICRSTVKISNLPNTTAINELFRHSADTLRR